MTDSDHSLQKLRWRLILGEESEPFTGGLGVEDQRRDQALDYLYGREGKGRNIRRKREQSSTREKGGSKDEDSREGGLGDSELEIPDWINAIHELFPRRTIERLEKDAIERYKLDALVTNPDLLRRAQPSETLLKAVLRTKHLMNQEVLHLAQLIVRKVVEELLLKLAFEVRLPFSGRRTLQRRTRYKLAKNFDAETTIRANLKHYDPEAAKLYIQTPYFNSRIRRQVDKWQLIILVDQSGSMVESVIYSAVTASIFFGIQELRTHLIAFDTNIIDLTDYATDPVETLMKVQLGGGTHIGRALNYAAQLIDNPRRTLVVLITDFYEGSPEELMLGEVKRMVESGVKLLGLGALDAEAYPSYNRRLAEQVVLRGAQVGAMTPGELAQWVAEKVQ